MPTFYTFILFICIITSHPLLSMLSTFTYKPYRWDRRNKQQRILLGELPNTECAARFSDITIVKKANKREQRGTCYNYAIQKTTGCVTATCDNEVYDWLPLNPEKYFEQTQNPHKKDLGIYTDNQHKMRHFIVVIHRNIFESKWGETEEIIQHAPFAVPDFYGDTISFWTLKKEYKTPEGRKLLLQNIRADINRVHQKVVAV